MELASSYNVIRHNYFHNEPWNDCRREATGGKCGNRNIGANGDSTNVRHNVFDGNIIAYTGLPADNETAAGFDLRARHTIVRRNVFHHCDGAGLALGSFSSHAANPSHSRIYHNTFARNGHHAMDGLVHWKGPGLLLERHRGLPIADVAIRNNLIHDSRTEAIVFYYVDEEPVAVADNWEHEGDPRFAADGGPPDPADPDALDYRLQPDSPCIDRGGWLTVTVDAGRGTALEVRDAAYFTDGFGIVDGDLIQLEGQSETARVVAVDYGRNTLTLDRGIAWERGQGVGLPYAGAAPDQGAFEYQPR
jgi:hypothetical protein